MSFPVQTLCDVKTPLREEVVVTVLRQLWSRFGPHFHSYPIGQSTCLAEPNVYMSRQAECLQVSPSWVSKCLAKMSVYISRQVECLQYKSRLAECLHDMSRQAECLHVSPSSKRSPLAQLSHLSFGEIHPESFIDKYDCFFINNLLTNVPNLVL